MNHIDYAGADYHKDIVTVCIQSGGGTVKEEFEVSADAEGMDEILLHLKGRRFRIMGEASTYSINLHNYLLSKGADSILVHPQGLALITKSDKKTDRHDAKQLASYLRLLDKKELGLSVSYIVTGDARDLRDLCRYREDVSHQKGICAQRMKAHMRIHNQALEGGYDDFSTMKGQRMLRETFPEDFILMQLLDDYVYWSMRADRIDSMFQEDVYSTREVELLTSIPGIGRLTAVQIMSMIVDIDRFETADRLRAYFGMATRVRDSGGKTSHGHITKKGDAMMREILGRVLNTYLNSRPNDSISAYYNSHVGAMGKKKARTACMNKLLDLIFAVLKRGTPYICRRGEPRCRTRTPSPSQEALSPELLPLAGGATHVRSTGTDRRPRTQPHTLSAHKVPSEIAGQGPRA